MKCTDKIEKQNLITIKKAVYWISV